jgi:hypothetical protein
MLRIRNNSLIFNRYNIGINSQLLIVSVYSQLSGTLKAITLKLPDL